MTAMSPGRSRRSSEPVRRSTRAVPVTPGQASDGGVWREGSFMAAAILTRMPARSRDGDRGVRQPASCRSARRSRSRGRGEQLLGVRQRGVGVLQPGQHPGQLAHPAGVVERRSARRWSPCRRSP